MSIPGSANPLFLATAAAAPAGYQIDRSLRFERADDAYLSKNFSTGNRKTWTFSCWAKLSEVGTNRELFCTPGADPWITLQIAYTNKFYVSWTAGTSGTPWQSDALFRDPSAWYHFVVAWDTTQSTASNRLKVYANGVQLTGNNSYPDYDTSYQVNSAISHGIGGNKDELGGYLAEVHFVDGQALAATDFGEPDDNGVWQPKEYAGTYGGNSFHLNFSDNSSNAALGTDSSGLNNTWTVNNLSATGTTPPTATVVGDPTSSTDNPFGVGQGYSVDFDGNDEIRFTGPGTVTGDLTVECFYKMTSGSGYNRIFSTKEDSYGTEQTIIRRHTNGNLQFYFGNGTPEQQSGSISSGTWRHAAIVYDRSAGTVSYYDHGSRAGTDSYSSDVPITLMVAGGGYGSENFNGKISNARITKQALYSGSSYTVPTSTLTTTSQGATASNVTLLCCHQSSTTGVEGGSGSSADIDSLLDTPTNYEADSGNNGGNYCGMNPLDMRSNVATQNGNMEVSNATVGWSGIRGTLGVSSGKWYYELTTETASIFAGIATAGVDIYANAPQDSTSVLDDGALVYCDDGRYLLDQGGSANRQTYGTALANGDILGVAFDLDGNTVQFYKNGSALGSIDISSSPLASNTVFPYYISYYSSTSTFFNFGQRPFVHAPGTSGGPAATFKSLCTQNLPDPTIADGSTAFDAKLYTGNGSNTNTISGLSFGPDLVWLKRINDAGHHAWYDEVRGEYKHIGSSHTNVEKTEPTGRGLSAFNSDGFTIDTSNGDHTGSGNINVNNSSYIAWTWDTGTSTVSNTDGSVTSNVRASQANGCSVVTWNGTASGQTVGHGLGAAPEMIIVKARDQTQPWVVYHSALGRGGVLQLHSGADNITTYSEYWGTAEPSSTVFGTYTGAHPWANNYGNMVAYCFAPIEGFSAFGSYEGNGLPNGPFVYTGHHARFLMIKCSTKSGEDWLMLDTARDTFNDDDSSALYASLSHQDNSTSTITTDILSNGFKPRATNAAINQSGETYIYMSFASHPFRTARAR